jgi:hypothetical protein
VEDGVDLRRQQLGGGPQRGGVGRGVAGAAGHEEEAELRHLRLQSRERRRALRVTPAAGHAIVARDGDAVVGHVQLTETGDASALELKNMAMLVATATADIGNLRFYQRQGFRMRAIERDAFTVATGYHDEVIDGIPVRDRVWLDRAL